MKNKLYCLHARRLLRYNSVFCELDEFQLYLKACDSECRICLRMAQETPTQLFSYETCEIVKNIFFYGTTPVAASVHRLQSFHETANNVSKQIK